MTSIIATGIIMMMMTRVMMMMMTRVMMMMIRMMMMMTKVMMMIITMVVMTTAWCAQRIPPDAGGFGGASHPLASFLYQIFTFSPPSYSALLFSNILFIKITTPQVLQRLSFCHNFSFTPSTIRTVFQKLESFCNDVYKPLENLKFVHMIQKLVG